MIWLLINPSATTILASSPIRYRACRILFWRSLLTLTRRRLRGEGLGTTTSLGLSLCLNKIDLANTNVTSKSYLYYKLSMTMVLTTLI